VADVDNQGKAPESQTDKGLEEIRGKMESELSSIKDQLAAMNDQYLQGQREIKSALTPKQAVVDDDDFFDPKALRSKILSEATATAGEMLAEERRKNATIYTLAQEYPEIQSDRELQKSILEAQKGLPKSIMDTADGYEMAVLKAIAKKGLLPKSKRPVVDDDFSSGSGRSAKQSTKTAKASDKTVMIAELLRGRALTKEEAESLEQASKRDTYGRYR
jgi:hypothetical protein